MATKKLFNEFDEATWNVLKLYVTFLVTLPLYAFWIHSINIKIFYSYFVTFSSSEFLVIFHPTIFGFELFMQSANLMSCVKETLE